MGHSPVIFHQDEEEVELSQVEEGAEMDQGNKE